MTVPRRDPEKLLLYDGFVRAIAHELVRDAHRAEDVAQETWLAALESAPGGSGSPAGWLTAVVRHLAGKARRGEARRREREEDAARPERVPSADEILEREAARARVVECVLALDEPYRSTLLLRYFENLPPRAIAKRLGLPVETVRTRTKRGLEHLRARLARDRGNEGAWLAALAPFLHLPPAVPASAGAAPLLAKGSFWITAMSTKAKLGVAAAFLLALAFFLFHALDATPSAGAKALVGSAPLSAPASGENVGSAAQDPQRKTDAHREVVLAATSTPVEKESARLGTLVVRVTWELDELPAAGVQARLQALRGESPRFHAIEAVTGADGTFRLEELQPGELWIELDRGQFEQVKIEAGQTTEIAIEIARGFDVDGVVVDRAGDTVADAQIWLAELGGGDDGFLVARSDRAGKFLIRSVAEGSTVYARAPRFAPSISMLVMAGKGATLPVKLVLRGAGGAVEGLVLDPEASPLRAAIVLVGALDPQWEENDGTNHQLAGPSIVRTDASGRFRADGIATGDVPIAVRARGFAALRENVSVPEHGAARYVARLAHGVAIDGVVVNANGAPARGVTVRVGGYGLLASSTCSAQDGSFHLRELEPGEIVLEAETDEQGRGRSALQGRAGQVLACTLRLSLGSVIRGRVVGARDEPLAGWQVQLHDEGERTGEADSGFANTDEEGRFALDNVHEHDHRLDVTSSSYPSVTLHGVRPSQGELLVRVPDDRRPSVTIRGVIVDENGKPTGSARISPISPGCNFALLLTPKEDTGVFELGPYPPGEWRLTIDAPGHAQVRAGPRVLAGGETWDVGEIRMALGAQVIVDLRRDGAVALGQLFMHLYMDGRWIQQEIQLDGDRGSSAPLAPGSYELQAGGEGVASVLVPFTIAEGVDARVAIALERGAPCDLVVEAEAVEAGPSAEAVLAVRDARGALVHHRPLWRDAGSPAFRIRLWLAVGEYHLEVATLAGARASGTLRVESLDVAPARATLRLR